MAKLLVEISAISAKSACSATFFRELFGRDLERRLHLDLDRPRDLERSILRRLVDLVSAAGSGCLALPLDLALSWVVWAFDFVLGLGLVDLGLDLGLRLTRGAELNEESGSVSKSEFDSELDSEPELEDGLGKPRLAI